MNTLIFEGVGSAGVKSASDVGSCRIRTRIKNNAGVFIYIEITGNDNTPDCRGLHPALPTAHVWHCYSKTCSEESHWRKLERAKFAFTAAGLLAWINRNLNCSFDSLKVDFSLDTHGTWMPLCESNAGAKAEVGA